MSGMMDIIDGAPFISNNSPSELDDQILDDDVLLAAMENFENVNRTDELAPAECVTTGEDDEVDIGGQVILNVRDNLEAWSVEEGLQPWPEDVPMLPNEGEEVVQVLGEIEEIDPELYNHLLGEKLMMY